MQTDPIPALLGVKFEPSMLKDGALRLLGQNEDFGAEIIPKKSVSFFLNGISENIMKVMDFYSGSRDITDKLITRAEKAIQDKPNTKFRELLGGDVFLVYTKIAPTDGWTLYLVIRED